MGECGLPAAALVKVGAMLGKRLISIAVTSMMAVSLLFASAPAEAATKPVKGATPTIFGGLYGGGQLHVKTGTWTSGATLKYKWRLDGVAIAGQKTKTLNVLDGYVGHEVSIVITGSKKGMKATTKASKDYSIGIIKISHQPVISGQMAVGSALTITDCGCTPTIQSKQVQWYRNGYAISGATGASYVLTSDDYGSIFSAQVTMGAPGYQSVTINTAPTAALQQQIQIVDNAQIDYDTLVAGSTLSIYPGSYNPGSVTLKYRWFANGSVIAGATGSTFTPDSTYSGDMISAEVTASAQGYSPVVQNTSAVGPIYSVQTFTSSSLDAYDYFLNCGGTGYHDCSQDIYGLSDNTNGMALYAGDYNSDVVAGMFGVSLPNIDPNSVIAWRITTKGWSGDGVYSPVILQSSSSSWLDVDVPSMAPLSNDGYATTDWFTTPMGGSDGHSFFWCVYNSDWGNYYVDNFVIEVEYLG
jgi:hypothetical protein